MKKNLLQKFNIICFGVLLSISFPAVAKVSGVIAWTTASSYRTVWELAQNAPNTLSDAIDVTFAGIPAGDIVTLRNTNSVKEWPSNYIVNGGDTARFKLSTATGGPVKSLNLSTSTTQIGVQWSAYPHMSGTYTETIELIYQGTVLSSLLIRVTVTNGTTTAVYSSVQQAGISLFPIPSKDGTITILDSKNVIESMRITSVAGQEMSVSESSNGIVTLLDFQKGLYIVRFKLKNGDWVYDKIIIE